MSDIKSVLDTKNAADLARVGLPLLALGKRHHCPECGRSRLITWTPWGLSISANRAEDVFCGRGLEAARLEAWRD